MLLISQADAQTTEPRGICTVKIAGKPEGKSQARTYLGIQLLPDKIFQGSVDGVTGEALSFLGLESPAGLNEPGKAFYIHVLDGTGRGFISNVAEFRTNDILCEDPLEDWMEAGTQVLIRPHSRIEDIFGADNRFGLGEGIEAEAADNVVLWDQAAQQERVYYFNSERERWEQSGIAADASQALVRFPLGLYIVRRHAGNLRLALSGEIAAEPILLPARTGANVFSLPINLSSSLTGLIPTTGSFAPVSGPNTTRADLVTLEEPNGTRRGPFYSSSRASAEGWREIGVNGSNDASQPFDFLSTLILERQGQASYVLAEGSLVAGTPFILPPDPEPDEIPLMGEIPRFPIPPGVTLAVEVSTDLQTWAFHSDVTIDGSNYRFPLPAGQTRAFYRLRLSPPGG
ncbi:MAG: hypothetical protein WBG04_08640 [Haloferula sp.]